MVGGIVFEIRKKLLEKERSRIAEKRKQEEELYSLKSEIIKDEKKIKSMREKTEKKQQGSGLSSFFTKLQDYATNFSENTKDDPLGVRDIGVDIRGKDAKDKRFIL